MRMVYDWEKASRSTDSVGKAENDVADAIEFCDLVLEIPVFHDSATTVKFIRMFDHLLDVFNSTNPYGKYLKSPR